MKTMVVNVESYFLEGLPLLLPTVPTYNAPLREASMSFTILLFHRFPVQCAATYRAAQLARGVLCLIFLFTMCSFADAETLTAVCKEPKGRVIGIEGTRGGDKTIDEPEGKRGGQITFTWEVKKDEAQVVVQESSGVPPRYERAVRVYSSDEIHTFLVTYRFAVWVYSIFPKTSLLLMTQHTNELSLDRGGAIAKSMEARCEISVK